MSDGRCGRGPRPQHRRGQETSICPRPTVRLLNRRRERQPCLYGPL
jgi:hypothetical protein